MNLLYNTCASTAHPPMRRNFFQKESSTCNYFFMCYIIGTWGSWRDSHEEGAVLYAKQNRARRHPRRCSLARVRGGGAAVRSSHARPGEALHSGVGSRAVHQEGRGRARRGTGQLHPSPSAVALLCDRKPGVPGWSANRRCSRRGRGNLSRVEGFRRSGDRRQVGQSGAGRC